MCRDRLLQILTHSLSQQVENALQVYLAYDEEGLPNDGVSGYAAFTSPGYVF